MTRRILSVGLLLVASIPLFAQGTTDIAVYGTVVDPEGKPIGDVTVDICVPGKGILDTIKTSQVTGRYVFRLEPNQPFTLMFTHPRYFVSVVDHLTHSEHQQISRTLYLKTSNLPAHVAIHTFRSYEQGLLLVSDLRSPTKEAVIDRLSTEIFKLQVDANATPTTKFVLDDARGDVERLYARLLRSNR
jgi:hypothetical protein